MIVKIHKKNNRTIVAVCDKDILGRKFEQDDLQLDLASDFYAGAEMDEKEAGDLIRNADIINLAGRNSVKIGLEEGVIEESHIIEIAGIPHAQAVIDHKE